MTCVKYPPRSTDRGRFSPASVIPHLAFAVDNLEAALEGQQILIPPNSPSRGVRVAFILDDGAPIELLEFHEAELG
jgi:hypothetical protein